jgi:hypothetical protein
MVPLVKPPAERVATAPILTVVPTAVPPERTVSLSVLFRTRPELVCPEEMMMPLPVSRKTSVDDPTP